MIVLSYTTFSASAGHFTWNKAYPNGVADLKRVTDAIRNAGLKVGLHIHYSKASRNDPYVTPVPDDRLHQVRHFTLSKDIDATADGVKDFCRLMPCPTAEERTKDFSRVNFGWLGRFGGNAPAGPDVYEYVASRAAAWHCPVSLHLALPEVEANPRAGPVIALRHPRPMT